MLELVRRRDDTPETMLESIERRIGILGLDLRGLKVVTEAATGAYASTAVIAALAGAKVHACARHASRHGSAAEAIAATRQLAGQAGVGDRIIFSDVVSAPVLRGCDILTNSGRLRPITADMVGLLSPRAVIALMFEAWEFRGADLDLAACRKRGVRVAAVNERHADVAVFSFLGPLLVCLLRDAGVIAAGKRIAVLCDNPFADYLLAGLTEAGAHASLFPGVPALPRGRWDAVVLSLSPKEEPLGHDGLAAIAARAPDALLAQFWGDVDRGTASALGLRLCPRAEPGRGHMGILLNRLGHEPIVRLQAGSLKAAEMVWRGVAPEKDGIASLL